jgi:hypothetical protein
MCALAVLRGFGALPDATCVSGRKTIDACNHAHITPSLPPFIPSFHASCHIFATTSFSLNRMYTQHTAQCTSRLTHTIKSILYCKYIQSTPALVDRHTLQPRKTLPPKSATPQRANTPHQQQPQVSIPTLPHPIHTIPIPPPIGPTHGGRSACQGAEVSLAGSCDSASINQQLCSRWPRQHRRRGPQRPPVCAKPSAMVHTRRPARHLDRGS